MTGKKGKRRKYRQGSEGRLPERDSGAGSEGVASLPPEHHASDQVKSIIPNHFYIAARVDGVPTGRMAKLTAL